MKADKKPSSGEVKRVFAITGELTRKKFPFPPENEWEKRLTKASDVIDSHATVLIVILLALTIAGAILRDKEILAFTIAGSSLLALIGCAVLVVWIPVRLAMLWRMRKDPYCLFLDLVESRLDFAAGYVERLAGCEKTALKLVRETYAIERKQFQERGESLSGGVTKLGIFPAVAAVIILGTQLTSILGAGNLTIALVSLILAFHIVNFSMAAKLWQMDRVIVLLDLAIVQAGD